MAYFAIDGYDIINFIAEKGIEWSVNDVDGPNAGRTMDAQMHRDKVGEKKKVKIKCIPMYTEDTRPLLSRLRNANVIIDTDIDPIDNATTYRAYCSSRPAVCMMIDEDGKPRWDGVEFSLIEV